MYVIIHLITCLYPSVSGWKVSLTESFSNPTPGFITNEWSFVNLVDFILRTYIKPHWPLKRLYAASRCLNASQTKLPVTRSHKFNYDLQARTNTKPANVDPLVKEVLSIRPRRRYLKDHRLIEFTSGTLPSGKDCLPNSSPPDSKIPYPFIFTLLSSEWWIRSPLNSHRCQSP